MLVLQYFAVILDTELLLEQVAWMYISYTIRMLVLQYFAVILDTEVLLEHVAWM